MSDAKRICISCSKPKATFTCRICTEPVCKNCVQFVDVDRMSFYEAPANEEFSGEYCLTCFEASPAPALAEYDALMERARNVQVYGKEQGKETRLIKRSDRKFSVDDCADREETILRLAFFAAKEGFDTLVDLELVYTKTRDGSFKLAHWRGTATGAKPDPKHHPKASSLKSPSR